MNSEPLYPLDPTTGAKRHLGNAPDEEGVRWVRVADREADLCEYLCNCRSRSHGSAVRAAYERVLRDVQTVRRSGRYLLSFARKLPASIERRLNTTCQMILASGRLGGYMKRKGDRIPGWQTLWRGLTRLATLVEGYRSGRSHFGE